MYHDTALVGAVGLLFGDLTRSLRRNALISLELFAGHSVNEHLVDFLQRAAFCFGKQEVEKQKADRVRTGPDESLQTSSELEDRPLRGITGSGTHVFCSPVQLGRVDKVRRAVRDQPCQFELDSDTPCEVHPNAYS
jgi:hypothetical protein